MSQRKVIFHPRAREVLREFPGEIRAEFGRALFVLQEGESLSMPLSRPMPAVYPGVAELRIRGSDGAYRVFYYLKSELGILVIHAFKKKSQETPSLDIEVARKRIRGMLYAKTQ